MPENSCAPLTSWRKERDGEIETRRAGSYSRFRVVKSELPEKSTKRISGPVGTFQVSAADVGREEEESNVALKSKASRSSSTTKAFQLPCWDPAPSG